jgi:hypothetical protein
VVDDEHLPSCLPSCCTERQLQEATSKLGGESKETTMRTHPRRWLAGGLLVALTAAGCGSENSGRAGGDPSCAFTVSYQGHTYNGSGVRIAPREGNPLGHTTLPPCDDTNAGTGGESGKEVELAEVEGVSPSVALAWRGHPDTVLIREDVDFDRLPVALARLLRVPKCDPGDEPIQLLGPWLGISDADGHTELEMAPPYEVAIYVDESSARRYERAYLTVRVPAELGQPLSREDIRSSLWKGGTISLTVKCGDGQYLAEQAEAHPPA